MTRYIVRIYISLKPAFSAMAAATLDEALTLAGAYTAMNPDAVCIVCETFGERRTLRIVLGRDYQGA